MTSRFFIALCALTVSALSALSLGGRVFYLASWALALMILYSLASLLISSRLLSVSQSLDDIKAERGEKTRLSITLQNRSLLPIAPPEMILDLPEGENTLSFEPGFTRRKTAGFPIFLPHVGVAAAGIKTMYLRDIFHLFRMKKRVGQKTPRWWCCPVLLTWRSCKAPNATTAGRCPTKPRKI